MNGGVSGAAPICSQRSVNGSSYAEVSSEWDADAAGRAVSPRLSATRVSHCQQEQAAAETRLQALSLQDPGGRQCQWWRCW